MPLLLLLISFFCNANFNLPQGMNKTERKRSLEILGLGTSTKFLSNAYPLGGYSGLEVSLSIESLDVEEITKFAGGSTSQTSLLHPKFTVGKGIYNNSDIFLHFIPFNETTGISEFGLSFRWSFYQANFFPLNFSLLVHGNSSNINNQVITRNLGADLLMGMMINDFSFFVGAGLVKSTGDFFETQGTNAAIRNEEEVASQHLQLGLSYNFDPIFLGLSVNRYINAVYNLKVGLLF